MIERESELAILDAVIAGAVAGRGGAVLVEGEAGIGKTALLSEARTRAAAAGATVLHATADELERRIPLAGARLLLARARGSGLGAQALSDALAEPGHGSRADEVVHALWWLIAELAEEPLVLVFDDAQWADQLTVALLRIVARRASDLALALIVAARPGTSLAAERAFALVAPAPLSAAGAVRLAGRADAWALTGGNPLYLVELAHTSELPPPRLVALIEDRLARLSPEAAAFARAVGILGPDATPARARRLAGLDRSEAAEEELERERLVRGEAFVHPVVAEAVRAGIGAAEAAELHERAAAIVDGDARVAEHLVHAPPRGDPGVVAVLRRAAEAARRVGAADAALRLLQRAEAEPPSPALAEEVAFEHGRALLDASGDDAVLLSLATRHAGAARHLARHYVLSGRAPDAVAVLRGAPAGDRETELELLAERAIAAAAVPEEREAALAAPAPAALAAPAPGALAALRSRSPAEQLLVVASRVIAGEPPSDPAEAARGVLSLRLHRHFPVSYAVGELTFSAAALLINADALDDAERAMDALRADAEAIGQPHTIAGALLQQAQIAYQRGALARCELEAVAAIEVGGEVMRALADPWRALTLAERGRHDEAAALVGRGPLSPSGLLAATAGARGRIALARGDLARAVADLADAQAWASAYYRLRVEPPWQPLLAEALLLSGRTDEAVAETAAYAGAAAHWGTRRAQGHLARMRALTASRENAIGLLEQAAEHFEHAPLERARTLVELGARRRAAGERSGARAPLRDAYDLAVGCGADALAERARAELRLAGGRPRTPAGADLTPAERRVVELAKAGATNREIARRLFLSPKTIEMHLRSAYRKLGVSGRRGLDTGSGTG